MERSKFDGLTVVALAFLVFIGFNVLRDQGFFSGWFDLTKNDALAAGAQVPPNPAAGASAAALPAAGNVADAVVQAAPVAAADPNAIVFPYPQFILTQGPHGAEYGHVAIDVSAGNGAVIYSPINGVVSALFVDEYNNTNLVLENERFVVTMLHGNYGVAEGQVITLGQPVGVESNNGYTLDPYGQPCAGRNCGYHTHLNVLDKTIGANVNPLDVLKPLTPPEQ